MLEAIAPTPEAARELWRWLLDFDWTSEIVADLLPLDHPLFLLLAEPRRMKLVVSDGLWVRLVDVGAALSARTYAGDGELVVDVTRRVPARERGPLAARSRRRRARPTRRRSCDSTSPALGSVYLGGFRFADLVRASRAEELVPGAADRGDALFRTSAALPWCSEIF